MQQPSKVAVGVVAREQVSADFAYRLSLNLLHLAPHVEVLPVFVVDKDVHAARAEILRFAVKNECDECIFVDDVVMLNPFALNRLVSSSQQATFLNYLVPGDGGLVFSARNGVAPVVTGANQSNLVEVDRAGLLLFSLSLTDKLVKAYGENPEALFYALGADPQAHFASQLRRVGIKLFVDHGLSNVCGISTMNALFPRHYAGPDDH